MLLKRFNIFQQKAIKDEPNMLFFFLFKSYSSACEGVFILLRQGNVSKSGIPTSLLCIQPPSVKSLFEIYY